MVRPALIVLIALVGMFIHPFEAGVFDFLYKALLFGALSYLVFENYIKKSTAVVSEKPVVPKAPEKKTEDILGKPDSGAIAAMIENDERALEYLVSQFNVMRGILMPTNGLLLLKTEGGQIRVLHGFGESAEQLTASFNTQNMTGVLNLIGERSEVLLENKISEAAKALNWYPNTDYHMAALLGMRIDFGKQNGFYILFDSATEGHFNREDLALLEYIRDGINLTFMSRMRAVELMATVKDQQDLLQFAQELNRNKTTRQAIQTLAEKISDKFQATRLTISIKKPGTEKAVIKHVIGLHDIFPENTEFTLGEGLHGWVITKEKPYVIDDLEKGEYFIPRFNRDEKSTYGLRSFLGVPLKSNGKTHGAIVLEHSEIKKYGEEEKTRLAAYAQVYTSTLQRFTHED